MLNSPPVLADTFDPTGTYLCPSSSIIHGQLITPNEEGNGFVIVDLDTDLRIIQAQVLFKEEDTPKENPEKSDAPEPTEDLLHLFLHMSQHEIHHHTIRKEGTALHHHITSPSDEPVHFKCEKISSKPSVDDLQRFLAKTKIRDLSLSVAQAQVTQMDLSHQKLKPADARKLAETLASNPQLEDLRLWNTELCDDGVAAILKGLRGTRSLKNLNLWANQIGDKGAQAIGNFLAKNHSLITLTLKGNEITDRGFQAILEGIIQGGTLRQLDISGNQIGPLGAEAFLAKRPRHLKTLNFFFNLVQSKSPVFQKILSLGLTNFVSPTSSLDGTNEAR